MARKHLIFAALAIGLGSLGCATKAGSGQAGSGGAPATTLSTSLESRVMAYWQRRQAKDLAGAYAFYCSEYKKRVPETEFLKLTRLNRFDLRDIRVTRVDQSDESAKVSLSMRFLMPRIAPDPLSSESTEIWRRERDQWCKQDEPLVLPFPR